MRERVNILFNENLRFDIFILMKSIVQASEISFSKVLTLCALF
jgi:hypothetical protein